MNSIKRSPDELLSELIGRYPKLKECEDEIKNVFDALKKRFAEGGTLYCAGNGGSAADCDHITGELMKSFMFGHPVPEDFRSAMTRSFGEEGMKLCEKLEGGLKAVSLPSLTALATAISNDIGGEYVFAQMTASIAEKGDVFLGISTSGNSANIVYAAMAAKAKGADVIALTGKNKCRLDDIADIVIHAPETETFKIQELHLPIYHALCAMLESYFFGNYDK